MNRLLFVTTALMIPAVALAVVPVNGATPTLVPVTINNTAGDQYDPHVSGDWAAYSSGLAIRYYQFSANADGYYAILTIKRRWRDRYKTLRA